jgi:hypothetical protein
MADPADEDKRPIYVGICASTTRFQLNCHSIFPTDAHVYWGLPNEQCFSPVSRFSSLPLGHGYIFALDRIFGGT